MQKEEIRNIIFLILFLLLSSQIFSQNKSVLFISERFETTCLYTDSANHIGSALKNRSTKQKYSFENYLGQAAVGSVSAAGFSILPFTAGFAHAFSGRSSAFSEKAFEALFISTYIFGSAAGVYWIAKIENSNLSFWGTAGYAAIGGGTGALLIAILSTQYTRIPGWGGITVALCPILGAMFYASFAADWPQEDPNLSSCRSRFSFKNLPEQTNLFSIEILRIRI